MVIESGRKSGAILTKVRFPGAEKEFARVSFKCRLSYGFRRTAPCVQSHGSKYARALKIPNCGSHIYHCLNTGKYCKLVGLGSDAIVAAVALPRKGNPIFWQRDNGTKQEQGNKKRRKAYLAPSLSSRLKFMDSVVRLQGWLVVR